MAKLKSKTHKGAKKRFRVSANGKVSHKRCGSSHLMSHKSGKRVRKLRSKKRLKVGAEAHRFRRALHEHEGARPEAEDRERAAASAGQAQTAPQSEPSAAGAQGAG